MYAPQRLFSKDREEWDKRHFWYQDKIHAPEPMYPLDDIFQEAWQISLSQFTTRVFCIPPAQGVAQRMLGCYMYITAVEPPPPEVIGQKAELFGKRVPFVFQNYDKLFEKWLEKFQKLGREMEAIKIPSELSNFVPDDQIFPCAPGIHGGLRDHRGLQHHHQPHLQGLAVSLRVPESGLPGVPHVCRHVQEALSRHQGEHHRQDGGRCGRLHVPARGGTLPAEQAGRRAACRCRRASRRTPPRRTRSRN